MIFFVFGKFGISIFPIGKKSTFVPKIGGFRRQKSCSDFFYSFFKMKFSQNDFFEIWKMFEKKICYGFKIDFEFFEVGQI